MGTCVSRHSSSSAKCSSSPLQSSERTTKQGPYPSNTQEVPLRGVPEPEENPYGLEANLHKHVICGKNPGHHEFIPVRDFKIEHLPVKHRKEEIVKAIKAGSELCVHIKATNISDHRPEFYPGTTDPYPFHIPGGGYRMRTGSGFVVGVDKIKLGCQCGKWAVYTKCISCWVRLNPKRDYWKLTIHTAAHVIYDFDETSDFEVTFYFDSNDRDSSITIKKCSFVDLNIVGDSSEIEVRVQKELGLLLKKAMKCYHRNRRLRDWGYLVVVASHPHGCSKHISVGERVRVGKLTDKDKYCVYTTCTCPGSSGGLVMGGGEREDWEVGSMEGLKGRRGGHSAGLSDGTNRSGLWGLRPFLPSGLFDNPSYDEYISVCWLLGIYFNQ